MRFVGIDPSTKTGFVALDRRGNVLVEEEICGVGNDPRRMWMLIDTILGKLVAGDLICIEGFATGAKGAYVGQMFGLGWGLRMAMDKGTWEYHQVAPASLKKFVTAQGNSKKDELILPLSKRWGFEHKSDNVRDAFVLAKISEGIDYSYNGSDYDLDYPAFQREVIRVVLNPNAKPKKKKTREG